MGGIDRIGPDAGDTRLGAQDTRFDEALERETSVAELSSGSSPGAPPDTRIQPDYSRDASLLPTLERGATSPAETTELPIRTDVSQLSTGETPATRTDRIQAEQIEQGNTGRVEILPPTQLGDLKVNVRADITLPEPPLSGQIDANAPAGDGDRQFSTGTFSVRATAVTPDKLVVTSATTLGVNPALSEPLRSVSQGVEVFQLGENNGLSGGSANATFSRDRNDDLYLSNISARARVQLSGSTDILAGPNLTLSPPGTENRGAVGGTISLVERSPDGKGVRQTTTSLTVSAPEQGGVSITASLQNGERNRFLTVDPYSNVSLTYSNNPGVDSRLQVNLQLFRLP